MANEAILAAIESGDIRQLVGEVVISAKASPTGKEAKREYPKFLALTGKGMAVLCGGKIQPATDKPEEGEDTRTEEDKAAGACDYFNYGKDLDVRASVRQGLMADLEGPEKAIKKAVENCVTNMGMDEAEARAFVIEQRRKNGKPV